jgi:nucleotide-binding universal stress UspA family protein
VHEGVLVGTPARELVQFAMNLDIDQIVVGTHGHSADDGVYLGSVSSALAQRAPCPVLLVR